MSFSELDSDVLSAILLQVHDTSRSALFSLLRVNRHLRTAAQPLIFRKCTLDFSPGNITQTTERITLWDQSTLAAIRHLVIVSLSSNPSRYKNDSSLPSSDDYFSPLISLVSDVPGLTSLTFDCFEPIPTSLLDSLHKYHPNSHLHVRNFTRIAPGTLFGEDSSEMALAESPLLRSLEANHFYGDEGMDFQKSAFFRIVALSPNLESYKYESHHRGGCMVYRRMREEMDREEELRQLFDVAHPAKKPLKEIYINTVLSPRLVEDQSKYLDFGKVQKLGGVTFEENSVNGAIFGSLKSLDVTVRGAPISQMSNTDAFQHFLCSFPPLEHLWITEGLALFNVEVLLLHHGATLRTLKLHEQEASPMASATRNTLSYDDLVHIRDSACFLENFEFDINRSEAREDEVAIYRLLSTYPMLRKITINLDLGLATLKNRYSMRDAEAKAFLEEYNRIYPIVDAEMVMHIWNIVRGNNTKLEEMCVYGGEKNRELGPGYPASWVLSEKNSRSYVRILNGTVVETHCGYRAFRRLPD